MNNFGLLPISNAFSALQDVMKYENGREILGSEIVIEWAKGNPRRTMVSLAEMKISHFMISFLN
jgi:hypothetical protein